MDAEAWVGLAALVVNLAVISVGYGVLKGTVTALAARVNVLEGEMRTLQDLKVTVGEVKTTMTFVLEQFKDLNSSIRWMREPADYETRTTTGVTPPRPRRS